MEQPHGVMTILAQVLHFPHAEGDGRLKLRRMSIEPILGHGRISDSMLQKFTLL